MTPRVRNWLLIVATLALVTCAHRLQPQAALETTFFDAPAPMVIAHQGGNDLRPGNTLLAFQHAVDLGVDALELDLRHSRDGALVAFHDATVAETTDGAGAVAELTLAELKALDAAYHWPADGDAHPYRGRGVSVPTLAEVAGRFPRMRLSIEIKPESAAVGRALCAELERLGARERVLVASFRREPIEAFREACPTVATSASEHEARWFYMLYRMGLWRLADPPAVALQIPTGYDDYDFTEPALLRAARRRHRHVSFWTVNDPATMGELVEKGVDGIVTDRPDRLLELLGRLPSS
ncbi:MAG: glycerophosphodiester phosphodiesterase [Pseudomonadota bacterium]